MLTITQLIECVRFAQGVGHRSHGHFDHNADKAVGPGVDDQVLPRSGLLGPASFQDNTLKITIVYNREEDPTTGEFLYNLVSK